MTRCPSCEKGELKKGKMREIMFGVDLESFQRSYALYVKNHLLKQKQQNSLKKLQKIKEFGV